MDPWNDAELYPQDHLSQNSIHGDLNFYRRRLEKECEQLCLQEDCDEDIAALREHPVTIIDVPKRGNNAQCQTKPVFADGNDKLTRCLREVSIEFKYLVGDFANYSGFVVS
jgi:hypothetical protein